MPAGTNLAKSFGKVGGRPVILPKLSWATCAMDMFCCCPLCLPAKIEVNEDYRLIPCSCVAQSVAAALRAANFGYLSHHALCYPACPVQYPRASYPGGRSHFHRSGGQFSSERRYDAAHSG
jgi:hypothetical protein